MKKVRNSQGILLEREQFKLFQGAYLNYKSNKRPWIDFETSAYTLASASLLLQAKSFCLSKDMNK